MVPAALNDANAKKYLGCTDAKWRKLKAGGIVKAHPLFGSYLKRDLDELLYGDTEGRRAMDGEAENPRRESSLDLRQNGNGSRRTGKPQTKGLLDSAIETARGASNVA